MEHPSSGLLLLVTLPGILVLIYGIILNSLHPSTLHCGWATKQTSPEKTNKSGKKATAFQAKSLSGWEFLISSYGHWPNIFSGTVWEV